MTFDIQNSVDHLRENGGISRWPQVDNVNRALHAVPRDIPVSSFGLRDERYTSAWDFMRAIERAAEKVYGCAGTREDYQTLPHSYVEVTENYMLIEWFRPTDPHEVATFFALPPLARLFARKAEARVSTFTFKPLALDPTFAPAEITGCPDDRDEAMEVANEAKVCQVGPREWVADTPLGSGRGYDKQSARNHAYRRVLHAMRAGITSG